MSSDIRKLLEWNHRIVLGDLLAIEKHLINGSPGWCVVKHKVHALEHGVSEAISHSERLGMDSSKYREFYRELESLGDKPSIEDVVRLRNKWVEIAGYIKPEPCPICRTDIGVEILEKVREIEAKLESGTPGGGRTDYVTAGIVSLSVLMLLASLYIFARRP